ncbi:MAG TPA: DUF481 domain-containing protein [Kofleriaceae bacterium]|nr:DUF481 domain-containing protein [Kofleriaceae bacterium]
MKQTLSFVAGVATLAACLASGTLAASAQSNPKFEYAKADDVKDVKGTEWDATAEAGVVLTTGNSRVTTVTGGFKATRKQAKNKFSAEAAGAFARTSNLVANDINGDMVLQSDEVRREDKDSAKTVASKLRYDRFLTEKNSLFVAALAGADPLAGKDFIGGGQLGYSRLLYLSPSHELAGEFGYDFSYENFATDDPTATQSLSIHSARAFTGYKGKLNETTTVEGSLEVLANLVGQTINTTDVSPFEDLRVNLGGSIAAKLSKSVAMSFSITAKYDNVPAPLAIAGFMLDPDDPPEASRMDTTTKASIIVTFL